MRLWLEDDLASRKALVQRALLFSAVALFVLFLFQPFGTNNDLSSYKYLRLSGYGLFPISFMFLVHRHSVKIMALEQADNSEVAIDVREVKPELITLIGENKDDNIRITLSQILFIKSADNYCELAFLEDNKINSQLFRCSLTSILKQLPINSQVYRCHRAYYLCCHA